MIAKWTLFWLFNTFTFQDTALMHKVGTLKRPKLSAGGFFSVNRTLSVAVSLFSNYYGDTK